MFIVILSVKNKPNNQFNKDALDARLLIERYGYKMKPLATITLSFLASTASAVPFKGAVLNENEIRDLYNSQCNEFMVYSSSAKSAMPKKLVEILSQGEKLITAKVLSCTLKGTVFEFYLKNQNGEWVMFDAESITIRSRKGPR